MTTFYGMVNDGAFWHWPTLIHFVLVALAGGFALLTSMLALRNKNGDKNTQVRHYALISLVFIVLDLLTLWLESSARFRFTHIWLFLSFRPAAPMWWGAWGLAGSAVLSFLLIFRLRPQRLWAGTLLVSSSIILFYPGLLLAANHTRPLWTPLLLIFIPITSVLIVLGLGLLLRRTWSRPYFIGISLVSAGLGLVYLLGLGLSGAEARDALAHFWHDGGWWYVSSLALIITGPILYRRSPTLAALFVLAGVILSRSLIVEIGQYQVFGF